MKRTFPEVPTTPRRTKHRPWFQPTTTISIPTTMSTAMNIDGPTPVLRSGMKRTASRAFGRKLSKRQAADVKRIIAVGRELKMGFGTSAVLFNTSNVLTAAGTTFDIAQGVGDSQRVGDKLTWCGSIDLKLEMRNSLAPNVAANNIRFMIFQWHPNSTPTVAQILLNGPTGAPDTLSNYNHDNRQQYKIIFDKVFFANQVQLQLLLQRLKEGLV